MRAADIMTPRIVTISPDAPILDAVRLMLEHRISGLPVVTGAGTLVGIVTEGDFLRRAETATAQRRPRWLDYLLGPGRLADEYARAHGRQIADVMTPDPVTVAEDAPIAEIVQRMERRRIKRVPVMRGDELVGIVSRADLLRALASLAREAKPDGALDALLRERIAAVLRQEPWAPVASIDVHVRNGVVDLWGTVVDGRVRRAIVIAVGNVPGVEAVHDHLAWIEPVSGTVIDEPETAAEVRP